MRLARLLGTIKSEDDGLETPAANYLNTLIVSCYEMVDKDKTANAGVSAEKVARDLAREIVGTPRYTREYIQRFSEYLNDDIPANWYAEMQELATGYHREFDGTLKKLSLGRGWKEIEDVYKARLAAGHKY